VVAAAIAAAGDRGVCVDLRRGRAQRDAGVVGKLIRRRRVRQAFVCAVDAGERGRAAS
jgi:hypothetical protein